jgi:hypothetical protein
MDLKQQIEELAERGTHKAREREGGHLELSKVRLVQWRGLLMI